MVKSGRHLRHKLLLFEMIAGMVLCVAALIVFLDFTHEMLEHEVVAFDMAIIHVVYPLRQAVLTQMMIVLSWFGANATILLSAIVSIILTLKHYRRQAFLFCMVLASGLALNLLLKDITHRPRPQIAPLVMESSYSFPSGHAMNSFIFYALLAYYAYHFTHKKLLSTVIAGGSLIMIVLIGFSRVYLGVHYPSDVLAGYLAGGWWFVTVLLVDRSLIFYRLYKQLK